jgi:RNA polymerase sigma-70 factor (ECF subfamily)
MIAARHPRRIEEPVPPASGQRRRITVRSESVVVMSAPSLPPPTIDTGLLDGAIGGDAAAWRLLHRRYFRMAASFLRELGVRDRDLEDATQEVFLQMFRYLPQFRREAELSTWLYRLCITQARHTRRRARLTDALLRVLACIPGSLLVSTPSFSEDVVRSRIEAALSELSEPERAVFVLYEMKGLPGKQIAEILECPEATVWRRLHYARRAFRKALGGGEPQEREE